MTRRRGILASVLTVVALLLTACTGLPTSGPVNYGLTPETGADSEDISFFLPDRPQPGASPEQIVEGFIRAGSGPGLGATWSRAREFLAPELQASWKPDAGVTIDVFEDRDYNEPTVGVVDLSLAAVATVDDKGSYERAEVAGRSLSFELAEQEDGEWRITAAPDGVVLDRDEFPTVFNRYAVMYFDPTWEYLVPDARWFPTTNAAASVTNALVNQPVSEWLLESVATAFPESVTAVASVPVSSGVAEVDLSEAALAADTVTLNRMMTQLEASLATARVSQVELSVESTPIVAEAVPTRSTRVTGAPLVLVEQGFGFLTGDELEPVPGLSEVVEDVLPVAMQVAPDRDLAAARLTTGEVLRLSADGGRDVLDQRAALVDPTIDPFGYVWSVPRDQPAAVRASPADGSAPIEIADAWPGATQIASMSVSRDGTRIAALVTAGGRTAIWVAGIVRDTDQVPVRIGLPVQLGTTSQTGRGLAWLDDLSIGVLSGDAEGSIVLEQVIGGPSSAATAAAGIASIAGGTSLSAVRLRAEDGTLYIKRGTSWQPTATGVLVLATQQGAPQ